MCIWKQETSDSSELTQIGSFCKEKHPAVQLNQFANGYGYQFWSMS